MTRQAEKKNTNPTQRKLRSIVVQCTSTYNTFQQVSAHRHLLTLLPLLFGIVSMAKSMIGVCVAQELGFSNDPFLSGEKDLPLGGARVQSAAGAQQSR